MVRKKKSKKKGLIIILSLLAIILVGAISAGVSYGYSYVKHYDNSFYPGVKIEHVDLSGKTLDEGRKIIKEQFDDKISSRKLIIKTPDKNYELTFDKINGHYDEEKVIQQAYAYGRNLNLISKYKLISDSKEKVYKLNFSYNQEPIKKLIEDIEKNVNKNAENAKLNRSSGGFEVIPEKIGKKLNKDKLQKEAFEQIHKDVEDVIEINATIEQIKPHITKDKLAGINNLISTFSTNYGNISSPQRANNIEICTKSINDTVLMPGDIFSFNEIVGQRTESAGYQAAPVIIGNQVDSGLGGGICQVSSTLYNAAIKANLKSVERVHHTLPSSYVPLGRDATVDWGNIDYKFKNTLSHPVYIEGIANGGNVTFNIYSNSSLANRYYDITTDLYSQIETTTKRVDDPNILIGTEEVVQKAHTGFKVKVYKNTYENNKLINTELISNDFYRPVEGLTKVGTKKK